MTWRVLAALDGDGALSCCLSGAEVTEGAPVVKAKGQREAPLAWRDSVSEVVERTERAWRKG